MNVAKPLPCKSFEGFKGFDTRSDETSSNANLTPLGKCPIFPIFGHFPTEKCFKANLFHTKGYQQD
jgi:hypothetical protein